MRKRSRQVDIDEATDMGIQTPMAGDRPAISVIKWIRNSRSSMNLSLSGGCGKLREREKGRVRERERKRERARERECVKKRGAGGDLGIGSPRGAFATRGSKPHSCRVVLVEGSGFGVEDSRFGDSRPRFWDSRFGVWNSWFWDSSFGVWDSRF
jgi:hypothetical protein